MHLKFFSQQPDNAHVSHSKCPLQFTNFAALMQADVQSADVSTPRKSTHGQYRVDRSWRTKNAKLLVKICQTSRNTPMAVGFELPE